jgi:aminoglycoside phosphotransferase (APT) family kinase protein
VDPAAGDHFDLAAALASLLGREACVAHLTRLSGGASRETWAFDAEVDGDVRPLILRRDPPGRPSEPGTMELEQRLLVACHAAGLAVPEVVAGDDGRTLGTRGIVMARVAGETLARRIQRDEEFALARTRLTRQCGEFVAGLQRIPVERIGGLPDDDPLDQYRQRWQALDDVSPTFELAFRWLAAHRPVASRSAAKRQVVVHGDFRLGNLLVDRDGLAAVLDWELAHAGDPIEDLGWLCIKAWRFRGPLPVAGIGRVEDLLDAYVRAGGVAVAPADFRWWLIFNTLKWGVICGWQAAAHLSGAQRSVELAAIGRRVAEQEWDLLELLDADSCRAAIDEAEARGFDQVAPDSPGAYGRPTAAELVSATRDYVTDEVMPATSDAPSVQFHGRVAANVLAIVERQLRLGPSHSERHRAALDALGVDDVAGLASDVREGRWDSRGYALRRVLATMVRDKLAVAEPRHLVLPSAPGDVP